MQLPSILIVTGYRKLTAYMILPDGLPEVVENIDFFHDGQTNVPLVDWNDCGRCNRAVADQISQLLERYQPDQWGLACPQELVERITLWLPPSQQTTLVVVRPILGEDVEISRVCTLFDSTARISASEKEHC